MNRLRRSESKPFAPLLRCWGTVVLTLLICVGQLLSSGWVLAGSGQLIVTPPPTKRNTSGLRLTIDTQWVDASGYRDIRATVATNTGIPSPSDRELRIEISPNAYGGNGQFVAREFITLPQGSSQASMHMLVPQSYPWHQLTVNVFEGGSLWKELSSQTSISNISDEWSEAIPAFLILDADAPTTSERTALLLRYNQNPVQFPETRELVDLRGVETLVKRGMFYPQAEGTQPADIELLRRASSTARLEILPPAGIAENWLGLTSFDFVVIEHGDLESMSKDHRGQFGALAAWLRAGGNLVVYDLGDTYDRLPHLEKLLEISPATSDGEYETAGWKPAAARDFNDNTTRAFQEMQNYGSWYNGEVGPTEPTAQPTVTPFDTAFGAGTHAKFLTRDVGMGCVVAMATANPYPGSSTEWSWVLNSVGGRRYMWYLRHGLSLRRENDDYWDLLVPNTGMAPVWEFCILITLFAVIIGPVNYFLLFRQKRLYLLLATIPIGAAIVTMGLFLYAVVSDGLGTRVRVRSYTYLDQTAGHAASWSRQSYYAGLAPSRGLTFSPDAAVYVSEQHPRQEYSGGFSRQRLLVWEEEQNLRAGYMSSRVTSQFLVLQSRETPIAVRFDQVFAPKSAQNGLGGDVSLIVVRDKQGDYFLAENVAAGGEMKLQSAKFEDARDKLKRFFIDNRPANPPGLDANQFNNWYGGWYGGWGIDNSQTPPKASSSLMEQQLRRLQHNNGSLTPGSYVAVVSKLPELALGVAGAREEGSFHVVEGKF